MQGRREQLQARSAQMTRRIFKHGLGNAPLKYVMKHIGLDCGPVRRPLVALTADAESGLRQALDEIGFFQWARN